MAILAVAAVALVGVSSYLQTQSSIALTEHCLELLSTAVAEFHDITGHYPIDDWTVRNNVIISPGCRIAGANNLGGTPSSEEMLYLQLSLLPQTREIISKLPERLLAAPHDGVTVRLAHDPLADTPYLRSIVDAWGNALEYDDYNDPDRFPLIRSDGPDKTNDNGGGDDIDNED
ncbi:hypothetical protein ES705_46368 [subsurface metagenome]